MVKKQWVGQMGGDKWDRVGGSRSCLEALKWEEPGALRVWSREAGSLLVL